MNTLCMERRKEFMSGKVIFKNVEDLYNYIEEYKSTKSSNSANSLGIVFDEHEYFYWYDSGTGKVINIDKDIAFLLYNLTNSNLSLDNVVDIISSHNIDELNLIDVVNEEDLLKGFKISSLHCSDFLKHTHKEIQDGVSQLILELTEKCNMRCKYCIYSEGYSGNRSFGTVSMSRNLALKAIDYMDKDGDSNVVYISFYGGEPLIEFDLLKDVIEYSKQKLSNRKVTYSFTTNLTLLTPSMVDYFSTVDNLSVMCSIDGPKSIHDQYRVYSNQRGTFEDVMKNFKLLCNIFEKNKTFNVTVNAVYMPPYSKSKIETIYDFFSNLEFVPDKFTYRLGYPSPDTIPESIKDEIYKGDMSIQNWQNEFVTQMNSFEDLKESSIISGYDKIHKRAITISASNRISLNGCCIPGYRRLYVRTNGDLIQLGGHKFSVRFDFLF